MTNWIYNKRDVLRDLIPLMQFKNREKHPWRSVTLSKVAGYYQIAERITYRLGEKVKENCQDIVFSGYVLNHSKPCFFFIDPGRLFHRQGPIYEKPFCTILVFRKETFRLAKLILDSILH